MSEDRREAFEREYGQDGEWTALFSRAEGFVATELWRDRREPGRYITLDRWRSRRDYERFREEGRQEYEALDARCGRLTLAEELLGELEAARPA